MRDVEGAPRRTAFKWLLLVFVALYIVALFLLAVGTFGWFGQERDPLSAVFLLPLGLPWNLIADRLGLEGATIMVLAPLINAGLLYWLWRR
ncbi:hypothetical protein [Aurantiacibacter luteus]|uniref:Uncharacterized protein n=1 Tax=Aurantiacibacter luteus TaxID=1581420 RepID=A0A0G9MTU5_9SPHN|nr:hypothetical protein [Aurantiacibacter luteus]KLE34152.1 hypothetical protein AAW00_07685 [Aurantiacibacter luteus]